MFPEAPLAAPKLSGDEKGTASIVTSRRDWCATSASWRTGSSTSSPQLMRASARRYTSTDPQSAACSRRSRCECAADPAAYSRRCLGVKHPSAAASRRPCMPCVLATDVIDVQTCCSDCPHVFEVSSPGPIDMKRLSRRCAAVIPGCRPRHEALTTGRGERVHHGDAAGRPGPRAQRVQHGHAISQRGRTGNRAPRGVRIASCLETVIVRPALLMASRRSVSCRSQPAFGCHQAFLVARIRLLASCRTPEKQRICSTC